MRTEGSTVSTYAFGRGQTRRARRRVKFDIELLAYLVGQQAPETVVGKSIVFNAENHGARPQMFTTTELFLLYWAIISTVPTLTIRLVTYRADLYSARNA